MLDEIAVRREKLQALITAGMDPYPRTQERDTTCGEALERFDALSEQKTSITLAGRLMTIRVHGAMMFADLVEESGKMQIAFKEDEIGTEIFSQFRDLVDPGDIVQATGILFTTKRGEKTLQVTSWKMLTKALLPLPEKWHGLQDIELRERQRELDLLSNPEVRQRFIVRSRLVSALRRFLDRKDFLEVETPVFHPIAGGASAKPFKTHHNALDIDLFLRIAPELYLKRLLVGGFEKVYEIGRCFRNEGIDYSHNPEFSMLELYWAFSGKDRFFLFMEEMLTSIIQETMGTLKLEHELGSIDFSAPWPRMTFREAILQETKIDIDTLKTGEEVIGEAKKAGLSVDFKGCIGLGDYFDELYKKTARAKLTGPVWITDYPVDMKPLANSTPEDPSKSATAQLIIHGAELINAYYYELNDPLEQRKRFEAQEALIKKGSEEAQRLDESFLKALEHGMPPASGLGMGIERLIWTLTNARNVKEVILFPTLRPEAVESKEEKA